MLYSDEELIEAFGHTKPTVPERVAFFDKKWDAWDENQLLIRKWDKTNTIRQLPPLYIRKEFGLLNIVINFAGTKIRFKYKEDKLLAKIKYSEYFK